MSKSLYSVEQRLGLINDCYTSGLSVYAWCKEKQIAPGTFYSWIHYLKKQGCKLPDVVPENLRDKPVKETHEIVKVNIVEETKFIKPEPNTLYRIISVRQCALKGLGIMQVEILSGKELTTPPEVSFGLLMVTLGAKRKQRDSRDRYGAPKYLRTRRAMLLPEQKPTCGFIVMVRFHTLLRCRKDLFMLYKDFGSTGENLHHPHPCVRCGMPDNRKGEWQKCCR